MILTSLTRRPGRNESGAMDIMDPIVTQMGVFAMVVVVFWRFLGLVEYWWKTKDGKRAIDNGAPDVCLQLNRIDTNSEIAATHAVENKETMVRVRAGVLGNKFGCNWKKEAVIENIHAIKDLTTAVNYLTTELRKQNGKH